MQNIIENIVKIKSMICIPDPFNPLQKKYLEYYGNGFFINDNGYILTCYLLVKHSLDIYINIYPNFNDNYHANIVSICPEKDIALLKINKSHMYKPLELGDSENIKIGDTICFVHRNSKSNITQINKYFFINEKYPIESYGCPVFNLNHKLIGIHKIILTNDNFINVVIPISHIFSILVELFNNKIVYVPQIFIDINNQFVITNIHDFSPLLGKNIKKSDIILNINGYRDLDELKFSSNVNDNYKIQYVDSFDNKIHKIKLKPSSNNIFPIRYIGFPFENLDYTIINGVIFMQLKMDHLINIDSLNLDKDKLYVFKKFNNLKNRLFSIVFISHIMNNNIHNLKVGDIIATINNKKVYKISDVNNIIMNILIKEKYCTIKTIFNEIKNFDLIT